MDDRERQAGGRSAPARGSAGPVDPHADPPTEPVLARTGAAGPSAAPAVGRTRFSGLWVGLILSALVLVLLLVFVLQNGEPVRITFLGASGTLPTGVALLLAAVAGVLLVAIPGTGRILQLRRAARGRRTR